MVIFVTLKLFCIEGVFLCVFMVILDHQIHLAT